MKHKKRLLFILALCLAALLAVSLVACNIDGGSGSDDPNKFEVAKYKVTFNTNSDMVLAKPVIENIPYGTTIKEPADENGNKIIPVKKGYTFQYWSKDGKDPFDFTKGITSNLTLTAIYTNNIYKHTPKLRAKLEYNADTKTFTVNENARPNGEISISASELDPEHTTLLSKYASSGENLPCPTASDENNKFCFWYYINNEGKPIQFSKWKADGDATVAPLSSYYFTNGLTLYPMFTDNLPKVTVKFTDSISDTVYDRYTEDYVFGQNIAFTQDNMPKPDVKEGYKFDYWYYIVEKKDKEDNVTYENVAFLFDDGNEKNPTSPMDAAGAEDNFTPVEIKLYAKWIREITITSVQEFKEVYDLLRTEEPTEEQQARIDEILSANIIFKGTVDFGTEKFEPLFDSEHPFKGTIDGASYNEDNSITAKAKITRGIFGDKTSASVFGYNQGTIKNLDFENVGLEITDKDTARVYIGAVATDNAGTIENCVVTMADYTISGLHTVVFGGITAVNHGITTRNGLIRLCTVNMAGFAADCEALTFGGIAGESNASASITLDTVSITVRSVNCVDDKLPANGRSALNMGGIVGINGSAVRLCTVENFTVESAVSLTEFVFGGVAGSNTGNIRLTKASVTLGSEQAPVSVCGSLSYATCIGGMVGKNEGYALNSHVTAMLYVAVSDAATNANVYVGGIMGSNYSDKKDSSSASETGICAINYCYSLGEIKVTVADTVTGVSVYAGGIAGRNSHKKLASLFSTVKITVANNGDNNLGHMFGKMLNDVGTNGKIFYDKESVVTLIKDGKTYSIKGDGKDSEEYVNFTNIGDGTEESNFRKADWVVGSPSSASVIGFGDSWEVPDNGYPSLKQDVYNDRT